MQLGFVIDHARCIGCHACTVACKSENQVPVGSFRTWVKHTESGSFPAVKRSFAVLRCNQCSSAPCVHICPVRALAKRGDGIVDVDPRLCIGCKGCLQACPYDALYINDATGTAEKCHFCAHRTELGLAPACAVVCPTEAIIPGDFQDPASLVSRLKANGGLTARKTEAGTGPNVYYRDVAEHAIEPLQANAAGGSIWASRSAGGPRHEAELYEALEGKARARTVYDVAHPVAWRSKVVSYLYTKSLAAGVVPAAALAWGAEGGWVQGPRLGYAIVPLLALVLLLATTVLLVADLKRPARFLYILTSPNWTSWIAKGTLVLMGYACLLSTWLAVDLAGISLSRTAALVLFAVTVVLGLLTAAYTAFLFGQARGRPLWMKRGLGWHLVAQAGVAGCALLLVAGPWLAPARGGRALLELGLALSLAAHLAFMLFESRLAPRRREEEYRRAAALVTHGPFARVHWLGSVLLGALIPLGLIAMPGSAALSALAGLAALIGLYLSERNFVLAGQALPIS